MPRHEAKILGSLAVGVGAAMAAGLLSVGVLVRPAHLPAAMPSEDDDRTLPPARHEARDIGFLPLAIGAMCVLLVVAGAMGLAAWLYPTAVFDKLVQTPLAQFPAPQLQTSPAADMAAMRAEQLRQLGSVFWVDRERGVAHIPIDDAMRAVASGGISDWPTTPRVQR